MILTNHGRHLSDAFVDLRERFSEIVVFTSNGHQESLNLNMLKLFSPFLRGIFASIPQDMAPVLIMPDSSGLALSQISKIFSSGVTSADNISYKDVNDIVEVGKQFGVDLSRISYEQNRSQENFSVATGDLCDTSSKKGVEASDLDTESPSLEEAVNAGEGLEMPLSNTTEALQPRQSSNEYNENMVKEEVEDNLLSFCEGIKGLIGKSLGIETTATEVNTSENYINPENIKKEATVDHENEMAEVYDVFTDEEEHEIASSPLPPKSASQIPENALDMIYPPMQMPLHMPMAPAMHSYPNSFTLETPPPDMLPGYHHQNMAASFLPPQQPGTIFISQEEYQGQMMDFHNSRMVRQEQPPRKKNKQAFTCHRCKIYETPHAEHFKRHLPACKRLNPKATSLDCRNCDFSSKNPVKYHCHIREQHLELVNACEHCEFTAFHKTQMNKHIIQYHNWANTAQNSLIQSGQSLPKVSDGGIYSCMKCEYVGPHEKALQQHTTVKHEAATGARGSNQNTSGQKTLSSRRKEMGWGPDDRFTCDYWNFVGKGKCRNENGHKGDGKGKVARFHVCALCFRNTGGKKSHPAAFCQNFPLPEAKEWVSGERGPSMADMGIRRGPLREDERTFHG